MKCIECPEYSECSKKYNLTIKRRRCPKAKEEKVVTNADRIRAMSDEELANVFWDIGLEIWNCNEYNGHNVTMLPECEKCDGNCALAILKWLKQPAEEE